MEMLQDCQIKLAASGFWGTPLTGSPKDSENLSSAGDSKKVIYAPITPIHKARAIKVTNNTGMVSKKPTFM